MTRASPTRVTIADSTGKRRHDLVAVEEPMEIRVVADGKVHSVSVTMRTPGHDFELAAGFLFTEGVIREKASIERIAYCTASDQPQHYNIVTVHLRPGVAFDPTRFSRNVYTTSSCGICGKASLEQIRNICPRRITDKPKLPADYFLRLPDALKKEQTNFSQTGGLHAAAFFDTTGTLLLLREDVGRHNAMDKLIGKWLLADRLPASQIVALVSGRTSFELVQKALMAGVPVLAAISAPSSLAVALAEEFGMTLIGFLRDNRFNVYAGEV
jgi:FdhD protein